MNGPGHYLAAEEALNEAAQVLTGDDRNEQAFWLATAQVHATLALAAATAPIEGFDLHETAPGLDAWREAIR